MRSKYPRPQRESSRPACGKAAKKLCALTASSVLPFDENCNRRVLLIGGELSVTVRLERGYR
jgi:hypothetical protein